MKTLKLILSNAAYNNALAIASTLGVPIEAYLSSEVEDLLDEKLLSPKSSPSPNFSSIVPDTLGQIFDVCAHIYRNGKIPKDEMCAKSEFKDAVCIVAKKWNVDEMTIRDKCCTSRRLGLPDVPVNTNTFRLWLCKPELLRDHLCRKFPNCIGEIHKYFTEWLPGKFSTN